MGGGGGGGRPVGGGGMSCAAPGPALALDAMHWPQPQGSGRKRFCSPLDDS